MRPLIHEPDSNSERDTPERCRILESWNDGRDPAVSIASARVAAGVTTRLHRLRGVDERYVILEGAGTMRLGGLAPASGKAGDVVVIPAEVSQQFRNEGPGDLVFYCVCTPRFSPDCYETLE